MPIIQQGVNNFQNPYQLNTQYPVSSKGVNDLKNQDNIAGKVADSYDPTENPSSMAKSFLGGLLMSSAFVRLTNWLMRPKNYTDSMTQSEAYTASRLYKIGEKLDNLPVSKWIVKQANKVGNAFSKIPLPSFVKELGAKFSLGSVAPWDKQGMYSLGKKAEAMRETATYFSQVGDDVLKSLKLTPSNQAKLLEIVKKVRLEKLDGLEAYKQLQPLIKDLSAKALKDIKIPHGKAAKILGTVSDLSLSASKAKFFAGVNASGPVGKTFNKLASLVGEASGGGVLGGTMALLMNAAGLMTGFSSAQKAEKGDKLKAFMEDYIGFTIGGYLMSMVVGTYFNKAMGLAELGMKTASVKGIADTLGLEGAKRVQDVVIGYNKEFKNTQKLQKLLTKFDKGKVVNGGGGIFGWLKRKALGQVSIDSAINTMKKCGVETTAKTQPVIKQVIERTLSKKTPEYFKNLRDSIKAATKSNITLASVFQKGNGTFLNKLGRWLVQKPLATAAKILSTGRYTLLKDGNFIGNLARKFKRVGGGIFRMWLVGFVLVEPFRKAFVKLSHKIFGKPKHSILDEEENKKVENNPAQQVNSHQQKSQNLVDLYLQNMPNRGNRPATQSNPSQNNQNPVQTDKKPSTIDSATYVPSEFLTQESYVDPRVTPELLNKVSIAGNHIDRSIKNAQDLLANL